MKYVCFISGRIAIRVRWTEVARDSDCSGIKEDQRAHLTTSYIGLLRTSTILLHSGDGKRCSLYDLISTTLNCNKGDSEWNYVQDDLPAQIQLGG